MATLSEHTLDLKELGALLRLTPPALRRKLAHLYANGLPEPLPLPRLLWSRVQVMGWLHTYSVPAAANSNGGADSARENAAVLADRARLEQVLGV